jgi:hypothetical protein
MTFDGRRWTLERTAPDFTPLQFHQRFEATVDEEGAAIEGRWHLAAAVFAAASSVGRSVATAHRAGKAKQHGRDAADDGT